jgi:uncharacterized HAD superfamily protein
MHALGIDLDGTIDEAPGFFRMLTNVWPGKVYIITYRNDVDGIKFRLEQFGIKYNEIICVNSFAQKAKEIRKLNIKAFFDDMDEVLIHIPEDVAVFKVRNGGNFDFNEAKWVYNDLTGKALKY